MERSERVQWRPFADAGSSPQISCGEFCQAFFRKMPRFIKADQFICSQDVVRYLEDRDSGFDDKGSNVGDKIVP